jgi:phosphotransacetylase
MDIISEIVARAKANKQRIVLPEGTEERTLKAADQCIGRWTGQPDYSRVTRKRS